MEFIKELLGLTDLTQVQEPEKIDAGDVRDTLTAAAEDELDDSQCFGLEMEDGKVVKVYVKPENAEAFETALAAKLGEEDDVEDALEALGKEFEIVKIVWPDGDAEDEEGNEEEAEDDAEKADDEELEDGSDSLNPNVDYDDKKSKRESFADHRKKLSELKWDDASTDEKEEEKEEERSDSGEEADVGETGEEADGDEEADDREDEHQSSKPFAKQGTKSSWRVIKDYSGATISSDRFSIELDEKELATLVSSIANKKIARFTNSTGEIVYVFTPKGSEYVIKTPDYTGGFKIPKDVLDQIMDGEDE